MDAPWAEAAPGTISKPRPSRAGRCSPAPHVVERDLHVPVRRIVVAEDLQRRSTLIPGVSDGTRIIDCCEWRGASGSVFPMNT